MNIILQGLTVSLLGILVTFLALGVFILVMIGLQKLFPPKPEVEEEDGEDEQQLETVSLSIADESEEAAIAAAIAYAIASVQSSRNGALGADLESGRGMWWVTRRMSARLGVSQKR